LILDA